MQDEWIFYNGKIVTVDPRFTVAEAVAVRDGRIAAVGKLSAVEGQVSPRARRVDLQGKSLIPGIVDSHNHLPFAGQIMAEGVLLFDAASIAELQALVAAKARELPKGTWIIGAGWIENQFAEWRAPNRWDLDEAAPEHPVVLNRLFGAVAVNSRALEIAGITAATARQYPPGTIELDPASGEPTGILRNQAQHLVRRHLPRGSAAEQQARLEKAIETAAHEYVRWGITAVIDPGVTPPVMRAYHSLYKQGRLPLRVNMMPAWFGLMALTGEEPEGLLRRVQDFGFSSGFGDPWLNIGALKMAIDGGLGSKTAWMHAPFADGTRSTAPLRLDIERLPEYFRLGHQLGWSIGIHCCGDRAQEVAVRTFAAVIESFPAREHRHNIIHAYFATPETLRLMREYQLAVSAQPGFIWVEGDLYRQHLTDERLAEFTPLKTYLENGLRVACNSDMTSAFYIPFWGLHAALTRQTARGRVLGTAERLTIREALPMFTINGAWLAFNDAHIGSLEPGKAADLVVLSDDILTAAPEAVRQLRVHLTMIDGRVVYTDGALGV